MASGKFASAECQMEAIPFFCLYGYPLCSCTHNEIYRPSKDDCERIIAESCRVEYNLLLSLGSDYSDILPDCNLLPMGNHQSEGLILLDINLIVIQLFFSLFSIVHASMHVGALQGWVLTISVEKIFLSPYSWLLVFACLFGLYAYVHIRKRLHVFGPMWTVLNAYTHVQE